MDLVALIIGIFVGAIVAIIAIALSLKKPEKPEPTSRYTKNWDLKTLSNPKIVAEYLLDDIDIPKDAKIVVKQCKDNNILKGLDVRYNPNVRGCFALGDDRAIVISGPFKKDEVAVLTVEKNVLSRLNDAFYEYWEKGVKPKKL